MNVGSGPRNDLTDVAGVRVGHHQRIGRGWRTGTTVVLPPAATIAAVEVRGGGPGTRETDALDPRNLVPHAHAVCLTGGSAYGLAAADGVMAWLEEHGVGFPVGPEPHQVVPIVPTAVLFDLGRGGTFGHRPGPAFGYAATARAARGRRPAAVVEGSVGAAAGRRGRAARRGHRLGQRDPRGRHRRSPRWSPSTPRAASTTRRPVRCTARPPSSRPTRPSAGRRAPRSSPRRPAGPGHRRHLRSTRPSASSPPTPCCTGPRPSGWPARPTTAWPGPYARPTC